MKTKAILFFVFGLTGWLLATNYQAVHSKMADAFTIVSEKTENIFAHENSEDVVSSADAEQTETSIIEASISNEKVDDTEPSSAGVSESTPLETIPEKVLSETVEIASTEVNQEPITDNAELQTMKTDTSNQSNESNAVSDEANSSTTATENNLPAVKNWMTPMQPNMSFLNPNLNMMNPGMYMNPMVLMTPMMMSMMGQMMNPAIYMNPMTMMNHPINTMTHPQSMNAMMMSMDPKMMFSMFGQPSKEYLEGEVPDQLPVVTIPGMPTQTYQNWPVNKVSPGVTREAKKNAFQTAMAMSPLSMRDLMGIMAHKIPVEEGVSWDDAVEAMKLRANEVNFKFVGSSPLWKQIEAETGKPSAKVEMFRFCDATVARKILDVVPEFIVFLPCKIALLEDGEGKLWVMTMDWDISWMDFTQNPNSHLSKEIREDAQRIRDNLDYIMVGAATGDF